MFILDSSIVINRRRGFVISSIIRSSNKLMIGKQNKQLDLGHNLREMSVKSSDNLENFYQNRNAYCRLGSEIGMIEICRLSIVVC